jgi:hypothetical protein
MDVLVEDWNYLRAFLLKECSRHLKLLDCCDDLVHTNIARVEMRNFSSEYLEASVELLAMTEVEQSVPPFIHDWFHWHAKAHSVFFDKVTREQPPMKFQHADQVGGIPAFQQLYTLAHEIQTKISTDHARIFGIPIIMTNDKVEPQHNKDLFMYEEFLLKSQIKVDGIDIQGNDLLRLFRKDVVQMGEFRLQQIDALKNLYLQKL